MIFEEEVEAQVAQLPMLGKHNVETFFATHGIDRRAFEDFTLRRFSAPFDTYYVSTVPRGLAGSTSDIDLVLLTESPVEERESTSNMLFFGNRRIGVKLIPRAKLENELSRLEASLSKSLSSGDLTVDPLSEGSLRWVDVERVVNGARFEGAPTYTSRLPIISYAAGLHFLGRFQRCQFFAKLAASCDQRRAELGYCDDAILAAMDLLMALSGRVQWNVKWTRQRWHVFSGQVFHPLACQGARIISFAAKQMRGLHSSRSDPDHILEPIRSFLSGSLMGGSPLPTARPRFAPDIQVEPFLPSATLLAREGRVAVISSMIIECLDNFSHDRDTAEILRLFQLGYLDVQLQMEVTP